MEKDNLKQEVLLVTDSTLAQQKLCEREFPLPGDPVTSSFRDKLEEACWNGWLAEWLLEIFGVNTRNQKLFQWKIYLGDKFLCARFSRTPTKTDDFYSLDPYLFLPARSMN